MAQKKKAEEQAVDTAELVTPKEHTEAMEGIEPEQDVASPEVPNDVEIAARSADMETPSIEHRKVFVLGPNPVDNESNPYSAKSGYDHEPNKTATRQYAISQGIWPTSDVELVSTKRHPDGASWILTYSVSGIPAHDAPDNSPHPEVVGQVDVEHDDDGNAVEIEPGKPVNADPAAEEPTA